VGGKGNAKRYPLIKEKKDYAETDTKRKNDKRQQR